MGDRPHSDPTRPQPGTKDTEAEKIARANAWHGLACDCWCGMAMGEVSVTEVCAWQLPQAGALALLLPWGPLAAGAWRGRMLRGEAWELRSAGLKFQTQGSALTEVLFSPLFPLTYWLFSWAEFHRKHI